MNRRNFVATTTMAGSAAFIGINGRCIQSLQAKLLLEAEEYQLFRSFVSNYEASLNKLPSYPPYVRQLYAVTEVVERRKSNDSFEVKLKNVNNDYLFLEKRGKKEIVKVIKMI